MPRKDQQKNREYQRKWWQANKEIQKQRVAANTSKFRKEIQSLKMLPCKDCAFVPQVSGQMEWDHVVGKKISDVSRLTLTGNRQKVLEEISKCELVCRNCHALRTSIRLEVGRDGKTSPIL